MLKKIWHTIKLINAVKNIFKEKEIKPMVENTVSAVTKPGYKTTEFWGKIIIQAITVLSSVQGLVSPKWAVTITSVMEVLYGIQRALTKQPDITTLVKTEVVAK